MPEPSWPTTDLDARGEPAVLSYATPSDAPAPDPADRRHVAMALIAAAAAVIDLVLLSLLRPIRDGRVWARAAVVVYLVIVVGLLAYGRPGRPGGVQAGVAVLFIAAMLGATLLASFLAF